MAELQPQFWFPQISNNIPNHLHSLAVVKAVNQVVELFTSESKPSHLISICNKYKDQGILSSSSLEAKVVLKDILRLLKSEAKPPFYVLGTVTKNEAVVQSWKGLGLNLFDLPWGRLPNIFHYVPMLSLIDMLKTVFQEYPVNDAIEYAKHHVQWALRWAQCHEWIDEIQACFGHGSRDRMQFYGINDAIKSIQYAKNAVPKELPCLDCHVKNALENAYYRIPTESEFQQLLRYVANLDCQSYRLASLSGIFFNITLPQYKRIVILEDYTKMGNLIEEIIKKHDSGVIVQKANAKESTKKWRLCGDDGTEIKLKDENYDEWETLVCFDLKLGEDKETDSMPGGLRILYNTALHHPFVSRLVITGYRTQDERSLNAGTCGFLLKPFTDEELNIAIEKSSPFSALWVCPETVRTDWNQWVSKVDGKADYKWIRDGLASWLGQCHIRMDDIAEYDKAEITEYSIIIMDYYGIDPKHDSNKKQVNNQREMNTMHELINDYLKIRSSNPDANIIIILPMRDDVFQPSGALHSVARIIRDGHDTILHKPMWICSDDPKVKSLGQTIKTMIEERPLFDVKYVICTPVMGLVWPKAKDFLESQTISTNESSGKELDDAAVAGWSPLGVLMGEIFGFSFSFKDIIDNPDIDDKHFKDLLSKKLDSERKRHIQRWKAVQIGSEELVEQFLIFLNKLASYLTIERWLRAVLDEHSSTKSLAYLFGGETRYEFGIRGGWYDSKGTFVQDAPLVIEFCGRKAILAREAIERDVVYHLKSIGGEQEVLFQEIPIRGFLK